MKTKVNNIFQCFFKNSQKRQQTFKGGKTNLIPTTDKIKRIHVYAVNHNDEPIPEASKHNPLAYRPFLKGIEEA